MARARYEELHRQGKTDEAKADLARLAVVRRRREEAARKQEEERRGEAAASVHRAAFIGILRAPARPPSPFPIYTAAREAEAARRLQERGGRAAP